MQRRLAFIIYHVAAHQRTSPPAPCAKGGPNFPAKATSTCPLEKSLQNKNYVGGLKEVIFCAKGVDYCAE